MEGKNIMVASTRNLRLVENGIFPIKYDGKGNLLENELDTGLDVPGTIQGEGKLLGTPCLFIRTSQCNLNCWVDIPGKAKYKVTYPDGSVKNIKDVKVGDVIFAIDEKTKELTTTTVQEIINGRSSDYLELEVEKMGLLYVTKEHPFLIVGKGWVEAKDLVEGDMIEHISSKERISYRMKHYNTITNKDRKGVNLKKSQLKKCHDGLKIKTIKTISDKYYYKDGVRTLREYNTYNLSCHPHENYTVKTGQSGEALINHNCSWIGSDGNGSTCDTPYSSHFPENNKVSVEEILNIIKHNIGNMSHIVVSGGEPMLQGRRLYDLLVELKMTHNIHITIETNGTIYIPEIASVTNLISISPKLASSTPWAANLKNTSINFNENVAKTHEKHRINLAVLQRWINWKNENPLTRDFQFKFVVSENSDMDIKEIKYILSQLTGWSNSDICLMPEGVNSSDLMKKTEWLTKICIENGWRFTPRLHALIWGIKRSV